MNEDELIIEKRKQMIQEIENHAKKKGLTINEISNKKGLQGKFSPTLDIFLRIKKAVFGNLD
jgi:hypothetical protein